MRGTRERSSPRRTGAAPRHESKQRLFTQTAPARVGGIADAVVIKDGDLSFLCREDGCIPEAENHGLGLYYHDCRYLSRYELRLAGAWLESLATSSADGFRSIFQLTNPEIRSHGKTIDRQEIGIRWRHVIDIGDLALRDELVLRNYHRDTHQLRLSFVFDADFADIFAIRGLTDLQPGTRQAVHWDGSHLRFRYDGADGRRRQLAVSFSEPPAHVDDHEVTFEVTVGPQQEHRLVVSMAVCEFDEDEDRPALVSSGREAVANAEDAFQRSISDWLQDFSEFESNSRTLNRVMDRSLRDLRALRMTLDRRSFFAAGVPWFVTLFGRDSLLAALQTLAWRADTAADTVRLLASLQGEKYDRWTDQEPGKILHEMRVGELARLGRIPHSPYYGSVDATPLLLIVLWEYCRWTGTLDLWHEVREPAERAIAWMESHAERDPGGFIAYDSERSRDGGLVNQGWKDSGDGIVDASGDSFCPPVALVEVQGYAYAARLAAARMLELDGHHERATRLIRDAEELRRRFNRDYWIEELNFLALALNGDAATAAEVISSNPGHALWSGIVAPDMASSVVTRLLEDDMFSGWGIRTLSSRERAYNPVGYHLGTVWPHDNALIVAGFRRYGFDAEACTVFTSLVHAASFFEHHRLPEAFAGFPRSGYDVPVRYPVACHPQAWAAGSVPFMLQSLLGLEPDAFNGRLTIERPRLDEFLSTVRISRLRVGGAEVDLEFQRRNERQFDVRARRRRGDLDVILRDDDGEWSI